MGKVRVQDLAGVMGISNQELIVKLKSIGVRVDGDDAHIDTDIISAILQGKKLPNPREVIFRDEPAQTDGAQARRRASASLPANAAERKLGHEAPAVERPLASPSNRPSEGRMPARIISRPSPQPTSSLNQHSALETGDSKKGNQPPASSSPKPTTERRTVFVSYSHKDTTWLERLKIMLAPTLRNGELDLWDDTRILAGARWRPAIEKALASARVAVFLVSADFLASRFIAQSELPPLLKKSEDDGVTLLFLHVRRSRWHKTAIGEYQAVNDPDRPLYQLPEPEQDQVLLRLCDEIEKALEQ